MFTCHELLFCSVGVSGLNLIRRIFFAHSRVDDFFSPTFRVSLSGVFAECRVDFFVFFPLFPLEFIWCCCSRLINDIHQQLNSPPCTRSHMGVDSQRVAPDDRFSRVNDTNLMESLYHVKQFKLLKQFPSNKTRTPISVSHKFFSSALLKWIFCHSQINYSVNNNSTQAVFGEWKITENSSPFIYLLLWDNYVMNIWRERPEDGVRCKIIV